jgi:hypothetical protein
MNRKYLVDPATREYLCVALKKGKDWVPNNQNFLKGFMDSRPLQHKDDFELVSGEFSDNSFYEKWIRNGTNYVIK